jgi:teichuronic acid biosynthesis glycosyltransferase TuaC
MRAIIPERYGRGMLRALVVSNMLPDAAHPERGRFVRDQVAALRELDGLEVELHEFAP